MLGNGAGDALIMAQIQSQHIGTGAVSSVKIATGGVAEGNLANNAVTNAKLADNAVHGSKIQNLAITTGKYANGSIVETKIEQTVLRANPPGAATTALTKLQVRGDIYSIGGAGAVTTTYSRDRSFGYVVPVQRRA